MKHLPDRLRTSVISSRRGLVGPVHAGRSNGGLRGRVGRQTGRALRDAHRKHRVAIPRTRTGEHPRGFTFGRDGDRAPPWLVSPSSTIRAPSLSRPSPEAQHASFSRRSTRRIGIRTGRSLPLRTGSRESGSSSLPGRSSIEPEGVVGALRFSPDGLLIAFWEYVPSGARVVVVSRDGSGRRVLSDG